MIKFILEYLFIFITGAILGWMLEVVYRRYFGLAKKWINPGFLSGPFLPLYGTGICLLYIVSETSIYFPLKVLIFAVLTTSIEYATGAFFLKKYHVRLWDYTSNRFNLHGHITPLYTFFWTILSLFFYFVLYPYFYKQVLFIYENLEVSLIIGIFYGVILIDVINSFNVLNRLKDAKELLGESKVVIHLESLKTEMSYRINDLQDLVEDKVEGITDKFTTTVESLAERRPKPSFFFPFKNQAHLKHYLKKYIKTRKS